MLHLAQELVVSLALDIARGVAHLHSKNVVHGCVCVSRGMPASRAPRCLCGRPQSACAVACAQAAPPPPQAGVALLMMHDA